MTSKSSKAFLLWFCFPFFQCCMFTLASCGNEQETQKEKPIARAGDYYLYPSGLAEITAGSADSVKTAKKYIENWLREMVLLIQAERNLEEDKKKFERMVEDYRKSLITYHYESELVKQKLDTVVSHEEIEKYYQENKSNFELKDNIIRVIYVKVRKNAPKIEKVKEWYKSNQAKDKEALRSYCYQYAENFFIDENTWLLFDDVLKEIPIKLYDKEQFLQNNRIIETQDSIFYYFVNIKGFMTKNSISPLSFEKDNIRNIIINKRKVELVKKMREDIYKEAEQNNLIEIF